MSFTNVSDDAHLYTSRLRQNGCNLPDGSFKCILLNENVWISIKISLKFVPRSPIDDKPALVQIMAWRRPDLTRLRWHDEVIKWKHFPRYWPFVRGIHRSPVNSPHKGQWRGALMFSLICTWISGWANNREAGDWDASTPIMTSL